MTGPRWRVWLALLAVTVWGAGLLRAPAASSAGGEPEDIVLVLCDLTRGGAEPVFQRPAAVGDRLEVGFIHSYDRGPVGEIFRIDLDLALAIVETYYTAFTYDARDWTFPGEVTIEDGLAWIRNIDERFGVTHPRLLIRRAYESPQWLIVDGERLDLGAVAPPGHLLELRVTREAGCGDEGKG